MKPGTQVSVSHLFAEQPTRLKFLKTPRTELKLCLDVVTKAAVHQPKVGWVVTHHHQVLLNLPANQTPLERLTSVFGEQLIKQLRPISLAIPSVTGRVRGWLGAPQLAKPTKHHYLAVNQRPVQLPQLSQVAKAAYGRLLATTAHPWLVLNVELPPAHLDVNTHPRKTTLRIHSDDAIWSELRQALTDELASLSGETETTAYTLPTSQPLVLADSGWSRQSRTGSTHTAQLLRQATLPWKFSENQEILQIDRTYLAVGVPGGILLFDQHAAHERILFEQYCQTLRDLTATPTVTPLPEAQLLTLSPTESFLLSEHLADLQKIGLQLDVFGPQVFRITAVPDLLLDHDLETVIREVLADIESGNPVVDLQSQAERTAAYLACRQAVKAGDVLSPTQRSELLTKLWETPHNLTCPHGRPTHTLLPLSELATLFRRR